MATDVYANSNEIASKSASGSSRLAFPDVCHTPPATAPPTPAKPFPPGTPVPYPNTCFAPDITNGSRTVFILGKEIALEDFSYFSTSIGDEAATMALAKGIRSGAIKGRAYFTSWSPNVKVEGRSVTRHLDWVSHNHSNPPNVLQREYISNRMPGTECNSDRRAIERDCPEKSQREAETKNTPRPRRRSFTKTLENIATAPDAAAKKALNYTRRQGARNSWVDDYCDGVWIKPVKGQEAFEDAKKSFDEVLSILDMDETQMTQAILGEMLDMAQERLGRWFIVKKGGGFAARSLLKNAVGVAAGSTGVGLVVTGAMAAWTLADAIATATEVAQALGPDGMEHLQDLLDLDELKERIAQKLQQYRDAPDKFLTDLMILQANASSCLRARKCMLVPFNKTERAKRAAETGQGCCPGQTGHHIIPGAMFNYKDPEKIHPCYKTSRGTKHGSAPTICLEGTSNHYGTHGLAHASLEDHMLLAEISEGTPISYEKARDLGIAAVLTVAPQCSPACLRAQLDSFYQNCANAPLTANSGNRGTAGGDTIEGDTGE